VSLPRNPETGEPTNLPDLPSLLYQLQESLSEWAAGLGMNSTYSDPVREESGFNDFAHGLRRSTEENLRLAISILEVTKGVEAGRALEDRFRGLYAKADAYDKLLEELEEQSKTKIRQLEADFTAKFGDVTMLWRAYRGPDRAFTISIDEWQNKEPRLQSVEDYAQAGDRAIGNERYEKRRAHYDMQKAATDLAEHLAVVESFAAVAKPKAESQPMAQSETSAVEAVAEDDWKTTATLLDIAHNEATSFLYTIRLLCSWDAAASVDNWAKSLVALLLECHEQDAHKAGRSILEATLLAFAATRDAPYMLGKKHHASAHAAILSLWKSIAMSAERVDGLYRRARAMLPLNADFDAGDGLAAHLFTEAIERCLSGKPLDDYEASEVEKFWPGLIGSLKADGQIQAECEKLRRGECVLTLRKDDGTLESRSIFNPKWLPNLQKDVLCDVDALQAELVIEHAKAVRHESTKIHHGEAVSWQTGGRGNTGQSDTDEVNKVSPIALSKEAKALPAMASPGELTGRSEPPSRPNKGVATHQELAAEYGLDPEATRNALNRWRKANAGGDGFIENRDRRPNEPQFFYDRVAVAPILNRLKMLATRREIRRAKSSGERPARNSS
jgi:hypothetical protein